MIKFLIDNPRYFRNFIGNLFSNTGDWMRNVSLMFVVLWISNSSSKAVSINMFCEFAPMVFAPFIGVFVDRWDRKRTIVWATWIRAFVLLAVAMLLYEKSLGVVYIGAVFSSICTLFNNASSSGFIMQFVKKEDRKLSASLAQIAGSFGILVGPAIGAILYAVLGAKDTLFITAALFILDGLLTWSIKVERYFGSGGSNTLKAVLEEMKEGFSYAKKNVTLKALFYGSWAIGLVMGITNVLEVFLITEFLGLPQAMLASLLTIQGIGMLISVPVIQKLNFPLEKLFPFSLIITGIGLGGMVAYKSFFALAIAYLVMSFGNIGTNISIITLMQTKVDMQYQGRSNATFNMILMSSVGIAMLIGGWAHAYLSLRVLFIGSGIIGVLVGLYIGIALRRAESALSSPTEDSYKKMA